MALLHGGTCLPPPVDYTAPDFEVPAFACDTHSHVIPMGPWKLVADASYEPVASSPAMSRHMRAALNLRRGVVVQASVFGFDNTAVLEALASDSVNLRGVAVTDRSISDAALEDWHRCGIRGLRFITGGLGGTAGIEDMVALAPRIASRGWHMEVQADMRHWAELKPVLMRMPGKLVIDHMGTIPAAVSSDHESFQVVRALVNERGAYVKLIGYRLSEDPNDVELIRRAHMLYRDAPSQMLWGTDWPHVVRRPMVDAGMLMNDFARWFGNDHSTLKEILERNPAQLFDF